MLKTALHTLPLLTNQLQRVTLRDGAELAVRVVGHGQPVVLLHGFGMQSALWLPNILPLAQHYRFIMPDLRGFGHSHHIRLNSPDALTNFSLDFEDILDHFQIGRVALGGISMGALTGLKLNQVGLFSRVSKYLHIDQSPQVRNSADWQYGLFGAAQDQMFARFHQLVQRLGAQGIDTPYQQLPAAMRRDFMADFGEFIGYAMRSPLQRPLLRQLFRHGEPLIAGRVMPVACWSTYLQIIQSYLDSDTHSPPYPRHDQGADDRHGRDAVADVPGRRPDRHP